MLICVNYFKEMTADFSEPTVETGDQIVRPALCTTRRRPHEPDMSASPPATINDIYWCYRCEQVIGDHEEVFLRSVCDALDCEFHDSINNHRYPGNDLTAMWLDKEELGIAGRRKFA